MNPLVGEVVTALYGLLVPLIGTAATFGLAWLRNRASSSKALMVVSRVAELASSIVAHVEVHLRPAVQKALEDGKLDPAERAELKAHALELARASLGAAGLEELRKALGLSGDGAVMTYLSGLIERALGAQRAAGTLPPPAPFAVPTMPLAQR